MKTDIEQLCREPALGYRAIRIETLPPLAWLVDISPDGARALVGEQVELFENGLVEGAWDGPFENHGFLAAQNFFGSGAVFETDRAIFSTPSHDLDPLFVLRRQDQTVVSNSLAFLAEYAGLEMSGSVPYGSLFATLANGIDDYERVLAKDGEIELLRIVCATICSSGRGLQIRLRRPHAAFDTYHHYHEHLLSVLAAVVENAADPKRRHPYVESVATSSSGYDSSACAALARAVGCGQAVAMKRSISDNDDSGARICQALGLQAHEFEGIDPADMQRYSEAEFIATGLGGNAYFFLAFERVLTGRVVFTGFAGDAAWAMEEALTAPGAIGPPAGATLSEFRLRLGFIHVPVPFIAFGQRATVRKISHSDEMAPFRVATGYDRPIPRRILQQAGVPGYLFGTEKRAASHHFFRPQFPISKISLADFRQFERQHFASIGYVLAEAWWHFRYRLFIFIRKRIGSSTAAVSVMTVLERVLARGDWVLFERSSPKRSGAMFLWALDKMRQRYRLMAD